jgi:hypothetical protein
MGTGIVPFELTPQHITVPDFIKNQSMVNTVYLIKHNPSQGKKTSHMPVIVDLAGESNAERIEVLMLHAIVDRPVQDLPSLRKFDHVPGTMVTVIRLFHRIRPHVYRILIRYSRKTPV